ncbi:MAG: TPM domain-containing protein [Verrucomicrobiota bacterium]
MRRLSVLFAWWICLAAFAAEVIPPAPARWFNDYTGSVPAATAESLDRQLEEFERTSSSQIVVAVFPKMQSDSSIEDYTVRVAQAWKVGQKAKDNGAVLFVFKDDRKLYLQVGYGLEGALPDARCRQIIANEITPRFKNGDFAGGLSAGVNAILAATRGEYVGTGRTAGQQDNGVGSILFFFLFFGILLFIIAARFSRGRRGGWEYRSGGYSSWGGGGGWSSGGGGGGFSGGGGSFGGGGAGGSW